MPPTNDHAAAGGIVLTPDQYQELIDLSRTTAAAVKTLNNQVTELQELLGAWRNARGAVRVIYALGNAARWLTLVAASLAAAWYAVRELLRMP